MIDPAKKAFSLAEEFKAFALKGNVIDMAIGVVIGTAFAGIVKSLVEKIITPLINMVLPSNQAFSQLKWPQDSPKGVEYGAFLNEVLNFFIIAFVLFIVVVKILGFFMRSKQEAPPPPPTKDQELLSEIRDLLKAEQAK
jgi:large conductance mechanosensitive channel